MIAGIGTDVCSIERIGKSLERFGDRLVRRILTPQERPRFQRTRDKAGHLAKRFAAKEAFSKALGTGIRYPVNWHNVWVENAPSGKPSLKFSRPLAALLRRRGISCVHLSLTDEVGMAGAFVLVEGKAGKTR